MKLNNKFRQKGKKMEKTLNKKQIFDNLVFKIANFTNIIIKTKTI